VAPAPVSAPAPAFRSDPASKNPRDALSAPALFGQANQLRLAGDTRGAIVVYKLLSEHHPGSEEAKLAELSLGKLFLASGDASQALTHFRRAAESGGALGSEALWGEAGALRALGRTSEERSTLERLLREFPDGAYAKAARKRLGTDVP
jgi:TolA-binding protein